MSQREFVDLIENVATELQGRYSTPDINMYLRRFGVREATAKAMSSKRIYVRELLSSLNDDLVLRIAADLGLGGSPPTHASEPDSQAGAVAPAPYAFISYQHEDRELAGGLKRLLGRIDVPSFLAHEDIEVSDEWRTRLLEELTRVTMFIAVLTKRYFTSTWCVQESGIATFRRNLVIVPLSYDGTVPEGFLGHFQAKKVNASTLDLRDMTPSFLQHDPARGLDIVIRIVGQSTNYRDAEANFGVLWPHRHRLSNAQIKALLDVSAQNDQVSNAARCVKEYIPTLLRAHGGLLEPATLRELRATCKRYGVDL